MKKLCECQQENAFYYDFGVYKCQYCNGIITDLKRVEEIIRYNTPVTKTKSEAEEQVRDGLAIQRKAIGWNESLRNKTYEI